VAEAVVMRDSPSPIGQSEEARLEKLYEQVAWVPGRKYGNVDDAFKLALTQVFFFIPLATGSLNGQSIKQSVGSCYKNDTAWQ
jgi:hypothetical protein